MAAGRIVLPPYFPARNRENQLLAGALLYVYDNETTDKALIYTNEALTVLSSNPVVANSSGQFPAVFAEAGTEASPVLYSVSVTTADGGSPGNPSNFDNYRPSVDWETAAVALSEAAATVAVAAADDAETALAEIEQIAEDAPDAPSVANKLNRAGDNIGGNGPTLLGNIGAAGVANNLSDLSGAATGAPLNNLRLGLTDTNAAAATPKPTVFEIMNQVPSLLSYTGGAIGSAAVNTAGLNAMIADMTARGRAEFKIPSGEVPLNAQIAFSDPNLRMCGGGDSETVLNFGAANYDCVLVDAVSNVTLEGLTLYAPGQTVGSVLKVDGTQTAKLLSITLLGGLDLLEVTGGAGGMEISALKFTDYTNYGVWLHDNVQGINWRGGNGNAGTLLAGVGLRCEGFVSSIRLSDIEILQGLRGIQTSGTLGDASTLCYSEFKGVYCDASAQANQINASLDVEWIGGWFSAGRELVSGSYDDALSVAGNRNLCFTGTRFKNAGRHGVNHVSTNDGVSFVNCSATNNGQEVASSRGFSFAAGSQKFQVIGGYSNNTSYTTGDQAFGIVLDTCDNASVIGHNGIGNTVSPILDASPASVALTIFGNPTVTNKIP